MVVLMFRHDSHELGAHTPKGEAEITVVVIGKLAYPLSL